MQHTYTLGPFGKVTTTVDVPPDTLNVLVRMTGGGPLGGDCCIGLVELAKDGTVIPGGTVVLALKDKTLEGVDEVDGVAEVPRDGPPGGFTQGLVVVDEVPGGPASILREPSPEGIAGGLAGLPVAGPLGGFADELTVGLVGRLAGGPTIGLRDSDVGAVIVGEDADAYQKTIFFCRLTSVKKLTLAQGNSYA